MRFSLILGLLALQVKRPASVAPMSSRGSIQIGIISLRKRKHRLGGRKLFAELDKSGDGLLQPEEVTGRLGAAVLKAADPDANGALNPQEYAALITARYKSANTSSDGLVDGRELSSLSGRLLLVTILP